MTVLIYDGTYTGFLTSVFAAYQMRVVGDCQIVKSESSSGFPICEFFEIESDEARSERVEKKLLSLGCGRVVYKAWLSSEDGIEDDILSCIMLALAHKRAPWGRRSVPCVKRVCDASAKVGTEAHRYLQFVRFSCVSEEPPVYAADIEPAYDILPMLGNHFSKRFASQHFFIRDHSFAKTLIWDGREWYISEDKGLLELPLPEDRVFPEMWRGYFRAVAIPWRRNKKLQAQFVPNRFRKYLTEFDAP